MQFDHRRSFARVRRRHVQALAWLLPLAAGACGGPPSTQAAPGHDRTDANEGAFVAAADAPAIPDTQVQVLSHADGTLLVRRDDIAYAPLQQRALNDGDPQAWRDTLPSPMLIVAQDQHRQVLDAIEQREGARAESIMREHSRLARRNLVEVLAAHPSEPLAGNMPAIRMIRRRR